MGTEIIGIRYGMSFADYEKVPALNGSKLMHMRRSAMSFRYMTTHPQPETQAQALGTMVHKLVLEPDTVGQIAVWGREEWMKVRNGKKWEEFQYESEGKTIMTAKDYDAAIYMSSAALENAPIRKYAYAEGKTEVSLFWRDPVNNRYFKARLDKIIPDGDIIFDLKTTRDCHSFKFGTQAYTLGYHIKMALYARGYEILTGRKPIVRIGAIDSRPPHESAVYRVTGDSLAQGWDELDQLVTRLSECEKRNTWPAEHAEETDLLLPAWTQYEELEQYEAVVE